MSADPDIDAAVLRRWLPAIGEALEALRDRLGRLEAAWAEPATLRGDAPLTQGPDRPSLAAIEEAFTIRSSALPPGELFTLATDRVARLLDADRAILFVADPARDRLVARSARGFRHDDVESLVVRPGDGIVGRVFQERRVFTYSERGGESADPFIERFPVRAAVVVPVCAEDDVVGVLYAGRRVRAAAFTGGDVLLLLVIADRVGGVLAHQALLGTRGVQQRLIELEKDRVLSQMAGGLSRELGNIFATILGKSRLLLAHTHDEPLRDRLSGLEEAAWRGSDVLHRLSALAPPLAGDTLGPVHVSTVVQDALALAQPTLGDDPEKRGASIEVVTDLGRTPLVQGNAAALREALVNIMLNAVDAMSQGGRLRVVTQPTGTGVEVMVEDTGEGIAEHVQRHAFDPFFTTRSPERLGLGLTVAQGLVTRCGGRMRIESVQGKGTRVTIWVPQLEQAPSASHPETTPEAATLPARPQGDGAEAAPGPVETIPAVPPTLSLDNRSSALPEDTAAPTRRGASILVLEDDAAVRSMLVEALTHAGHAVQTGADGQSALGMLESGRFDVVLTDFALPQCSGLVVARAVKRVSPNTPVVLITGWGHLLDPERLREHGVDLMLVKPFRVERVLSVVSDALRLRSVS